MKCFTTIVAVCVCTALSSLASTELFERIKDMSPQSQLEYLRDAERSGATAPIYFYMGNAHYALSQFDSAVTYYYKATEIDTTYSKAFVNMGLAYDSMHQLSAARSAFQMAIDANPNDVLAYCHLGYNLASRGEMNEAIGHYLKALEIDPNSAQAHYNLGLAFADSKVFNEALAEWNKVIELDPDGELGRIARENVELIKTYLELDR